MSHRPALTMVANSTKASQSLLLAPLLLLLLLTVTPLLSSAQEILTDEDIETFENTVLKGKFDSEAVDYYSSQAPAAVILGIAIALLCFVSTIVFVFVRFYYCCCHKKTQYEVEDLDDSSGQNKDAGCGYFCWEGGKSREHQHVSRGLKIFVILMSAGVVLGCALSVWGVVKFTVAMRGVKNVTLLDHGVESLFDLVSRVEDVVEDAIDTVGDYQLEERSFESAFEAENASTSILDNVRQPVNDGVEYVEGDVNSVAELALIVINAAGVGVAALVAGLTLMGMLGTINGGRWSTACSICVVPMWLVSAWIVFAVFSIGHKVFDVVCTELEVVAGCQANSTDAALCEESYTWGALNDFWIDNLNLNEVSRDLSVEIQRAVTERGNEELDHLYSSVCDAVEQLNNSTTSHPRVKVPEYCLNGTALLPLCERITPPAADDNPLTTTTPIISLTYDNQSRCAFLSEFNASFADEHCAKVPDTIAALEELVSNDPNSAATAWLDEPPPVLMCMQEGRIIGSAMFQNLSNLAINSSTLLGELDSRLDALKLEPLRVVVELLAYTDCPATLDALYLLYVSYALIGVFLIICSICWLLGMYGEQFSGAVAPESGGTANNARNGGDGGRHDNNGGTFNGTLENLHEGLERTNSIFSQTVATVNEAGELVDTAHGLATDLLSNLVGGDGGEDE